jgi:ParB family chromosome partitioning protein
MAKKIALGKGIASLIQETPNQILEKSLKDEVEREVKEAAAKNDYTPYLVAISEIKTNPNQPRKIFKEQELQELSASIKENGVIQPLVVTKSDQGFELVAGERRLRASKMAGLDQVPVIIKRGTDKEKMIMSIIENVQRSDLNCVEEALAYYHLMNEYGLNQEEVAKKLGKERSSVANYLRILKLPREVVELLQKEQLSFGHAKILASIKEREKAIRLANVAVEDGMSVRELEKLSKKKVAPAKERKPVYEAEKLDQYRQKLENKTGFHFKLAAKNNGSGQVTIKFSNEAEFNDIYEYLLTR